MCQINVLIVEIDLGQLAKMFMFAKEFVATFWSSIACSYCTSKFWLDIWRIVLSNFFYIY